MFNKIMKRIFLFSLLVSVMFVGSPIYAEMGDSATLGHDDTNNTDYWRVLSTGNFVPGTDSNVNIGASGTEVKTLYVDTIVIGGDTISGASQLTSPIEDAGTYCRPIDAADAIKLYDSGAITATGAITGGSFVMDNGATFDNAVNNYITLVENSDTLTFYFDGTDTSIDHSDGGVTIKLSDATDGTFDIYCNGVTTDYIAISQGTNQSTITATGTGNDLYLAAAGGDINCADENITTTGTLTAAAIAGVDTITGSTNSDVLSFATDDALQFSSDNGDNATKVIVTGYGDKDAIVLLQADNSDDSGDDWQIESDETSNSLIVSNDTSGSQVAKLTLSSTGNATLGGTTVTLSNGEYANNTTDDTYRVGSDDSSVILDVYSPNTSDGTASITLQGDAGTDATDRWRIQNPADGTLTVANDSAVAGTYVTKLTLSSAGLMTMTGGITLSDSEAITDVSDVVIITADDADSSLHLLGYEANDASIILTADQDDDATDSWKIEGNTSGNLTIANDSSVAGTYVTKLTVSSAGILTLADSETITNASDVVTLTADDGAANLTLLGFEANASYLTLNADQDDDATDGWRLGATTSGTLTFANDSSAAGTYLTKLTLSSAGVLTLPDSETISNTSDYVVFTQDDNDGGIMVTGFESKDANIILQADQDDDAGDGWLLESDQTANSFILSNDTGVAGTYLSRFSVTKNGTAAITGYEGQTSVLQLLSDEDDDATDGFALTSSGGNLTIGNDSSVAGTFVTKLTLSNAGVVTLVNGETITNSATDDTVTIASDDAAMVLAIKDSDAADGDATLLLQADVSADNGDDWAIVSDGATNSLFFQNDTSGSQVTKFTLATTGAVTLANSLTFSDSEILSNASDVLTLTADDGAGAFTILGFESNDSYLRLSADQDDDATDSWQLESDQATGSLIIGNDSSVAGTYLQKLAVSSAGVITLVDSETLTNASDILTLTGDDNDTAFVVTGFEAKDAYIRLLADQDDDATDGWQIESDQATGSLSIGNDTSAAGTFIAKLDITSAGAATLYGTTDGILNVRGSGTSDGDATVILQADNTTDNGDDWEIQHDGATNNLNIDNDVSGSMVTKLSITTAGAATLTGTTDGILNVTGAGTSDGDSSIIMKADNSTDNGDDWQIQHDGATNNLTLSNDTSGSQVAKMTLTTAGNMTITGTATFSGGQTRKWVVPDDCIVVDGANAPSVSTCGTNAQHLRKAWKFDADGGATGDDIVFINWVVPDGYVTDSARLNIYWSYSTAETDGDDVVFDMKVNAIAAGEVLDSAGTAFTEGDTDIANGDGDEGKLMYTQLNIEVEDIVIGDEVCIMFWVDENVSDLNASSTCDITKFEIQYESTE